MCKPFERQREKTYLLICALNEGSNQPVHQCLHQETLHPWLSKIRIVKILIRLRERAGWSKSLLGADVRRYLFWRSSSLRSSTTVSTLKYSWHLITSPYLPLTLNDYILLLFWCVRTNADWVANSVNPDQTPRSVASDLGLHSLLKHFCPNN